MNLINILAIEDFKPDIVLLQKYLEEAEFKYNFFHKETLREGIDLIKEQDMDIVLLDLSLSDTSGFKTLTRYLEEVNDVPVIVMTGMPSKAFGERAVKEGAEDYLYKENMDSRSVEKSIIFSLHRGKSKLKIRERNKQLEKNEDTLRKVLHIAKIGSWSMNIIDNSMNWDDEMFRIFELSNQTFNPTLSDYLGFVHVEDRQKVEAFFGMVMKDSEKHEIKHRIVINNTKTKELFVHAGIVHNETTQQVSIVGGVQDITAYENGILPGDKMLQEIKSNKLLQNLKTNFTSLLDCKLFLEMSGYSNEMADKRIKKVCQKIAQNYANHRYQLLIHRLLIKSDDLRPVVLENISADELQKLLSLFDVSKQSFFSTLNVKIHHGLPNQVSINFGLLFYTLYTLHKISTYRKTGKNLINVNFSFVKNKEDRAGVLLDIRGDLDKHGLLNNSAKSSTPLEYIARYPDDGETVWYCFALIRLVQLANGTFEKQPFDKNGRPRTRIYLPILKQDETQEVPTQSNGQEYKFLIVDDRFFNRLQIKTKLEKWNGKRVKIEEAENGKEAIKKVETNDFDAIFMDIQMPIMNGIEASSFIKSKFPIPIVALTNKSSEQEKQACQKIGIEAYLQKPIPAQTLFSTIEPLIKP